MKKITKPKPIDKEIKLDPSKVIMSKTDAIGVIEYANEYFMEVSGYEEQELMGQPHNIIRHPDMPKIIFKLIWQRLDDGKNIHALVKNLAKDGRYYWVLTNFETKYDKNGKIVSHYARRKAAPGNAIYEIEKLYKTVLAIEQRKDPEIAEKFFYGLLEDREQSYDEFILDLLNISKESLKAYFKDIVVSKVQTEKKKTGLLDKLFKKEATN